MLRILIIDDEPPARARLARMLDALPDCAVAGQAASGREALEMIAHLQPDMLLLDISMPGLDGMALARMLKEREPAPAVVFCTAWPDQALEAFDCDAVDYLVKPVRKERLQMALDKVRRVLGGGAGEEPYLRSKVGGKTSLIPLKEVICLLAEDKYTTVIHAAGRSVINNSLVDLEKRFPNRLLRVHRNALVAPGRIRGLRNTGSGSSCLVLEGTDLRPEVSRRNLSAIRRILRDMG